MDLTVSLINHSNPTLLLDCLRSIYANTNGIDFEVWVVDNATDGDGVEKIKAEFPDVKWIVNSERRGFSANHNQVLLKAKSRYVCILNDDTIIHGNCFRETISFMETNCDVGVVGPRILNTDGTLQSSTFNFPSLKIALFDTLHLPNAFIRFKCLGISGAQYENNPVESDWILGACIFVRSVALDRVGLLDEELSPVVYMEDVDWCRRFWNAGWRVIYYPAAIITHIGGQSTKPSVIGSDKMRVLLHQACVRYFRKHLGLIRTSLLKLIYIMNIPWNFVMLLQSFLRKKKKLSECKAELTTRIKIAGVSALS
ncbi:MAG: glycosyltransferase family 2 protein [Pyrinomonadaceae bacterium MAG19_C2-C3]|nr:glycosyltransferase family 2 protein [Pyrinomonadaceae bacterium MAG19_C2-C3]